MEFDLFVFVFRVDLRNCSRFFEDVLPGKLLILDLSNEIFISCVLLPGSFETVLCVVPHALLYLLRNIQIGFRLLVNLNLSVGSNQIDQVIQAIGIVDCGPVCVGVHLGGKLAHVAWLVIAHAPGEELDSVYLFTELKGYLLH